MKAVGCGCGSKTKKENEGSKGRKEAVEVVTKPPLLSAVQKEGLLGRLLIIPRTAGRRLTDRLAVWLVLSVTMMRLPQPAVLMGVLFPTREADLLGNRYIR